VPIGITEDRPIQVSDPPDDDVVMQRGQRFRFVAIVGLVVALTTAGFALAGGNTFDTSEEPQPTVCPPSGGTVDEGDSTDETTEDGDSTDEGNTTDEGDQGDSTDEGDQGDSADEAEQGDSAHCEDPADEADSSDDAGAPTDEPTVERSATDASPEQIAACTEAAGLTAADAPTEKPVAGELKGLENAISHVLWNCMRNDNEGLVNALEHLSANLERKQLRDEAKAERKAAHDAAKAERKAEREAAKAARELEHAS
jgi:hypothetical protein